jgi:uncharacterized membrane protein
MNNSINFGPRLRIRWYAFAVVALVCQFPRAPISGAAEFIRLGALDAPQKFSRALSISDYGSVVAGTTTISATVSLAPFRWTRETGMVVLDSSQSLGEVIMSADGAVIAWEAPSTQTLPTRARILTQDFGRFDFDFRFVAGDAPGWHDETISDDGSVLVGNAQPSLLSPPGSPEGVARWTPQGGIQTLGNPPGSTFGPGATTSHLLSPDGSVVVGTGRVLPSSPPDTPLFRWTADEGMTSLGDVSGHNFYEITGISTNGSIVTGISKQILEDATISASSLWRWTKATGLVVLEEGTPELNFIGQPPRVGKWLSADGKALVGERRSADGGQSEAYRWTDETGFELFPTLPGRPNAAVRDITPDGKWVFGQCWANPGDNFAPYTLTRQVPWLWSEETGTLNLLDVFEGQGLGASIAGWESLWYGNANWGRISADGRAIIGSGYNPEGFPEAWVAYLDPIAVPEAPSAAFGMLALACCSFPFRCARSISYFSNRSFAPPCRRLT